MYSAGDKIVHLRHGAGAVLEPRRIEREGTIKEYFCVDLIGGRGLLMIPIEKLDITEFRPAITDFQLIQAELRSTPQSLEADHRTRQQHLKDQIRSQQPENLIRALRDLCWLEHIDKLTFTDAQLKDQLMRMLAQELALSPQWTFETARQQLLSVVDEALDAHVQAAAGV